MYLLCDMAKKRKLSEDGFVFSTNRDFDFDEGEEQDSLPMDEQNLWVYHDRKQRKGKVVTVVSGFEGNKEDLKELSKKLKSKCGVGGAVKDGLILIQGSFADKIMDILKNEGARVKKSGG